MLKIGQNRENLHYLKFYQNLCNKYIYIILLKICSGMPKEKEGMKTITKLKQYIYHHTYLLQREDI